MDGVADSGQESSYLSRQGRYLDPSAQFDADFGLHSAMSFSWKRRMAAMPAAPASRQDGRWIE